MRLPEWDDPDRRDAALARVAARLAQADPLTEKELAVVFLASHGIRRADAAQMLGVSEHAVADRAKHAQSKLGARSQAHTVATALRLGVIS